MAIEWEKVWSCDEIIRMGVFQQKWIWKGCWMFHLCHSSQLLQPQHMVYPRMLLHQNVKVRKGAKTIWRVCQNWWNSRISMGEYCLVLYSAQKDEISLFYFGTGCQVCWRKLEIVVKFPFCFSLIETVLQILWLCTENRSIKSRWGPYSTNSCQNISSYGVQIIWGCRWQVQKENRLQLQAKNWQSLPIFGWKDWSESFNMVS